MAVVRLPYFIRYPKQYALFRWLARPKPAPAPAFHDGALANPALSALDEACRRLGLELAGQDEPVRRRYSIGAVVADPKGKRYWLKVSAYKDRYPDTVRRKLLGPPTIPGVPMPLILETAEWLLDDVHWLAMQIALAPSPAIERSAYARENAERVSDRWIASLKAALDSLAASNLDAKRRVSPQTLRRTIVRRWGENAPYTVDDWRPTHGDLQWSNVTAPHLMLLDWSEFGLGPRGYDAAKLIFCTFYQPDLARRLEEAFADDLQSKSGRVAMLLAAARRLNTIEAIRGTGKYQAWIKEKAERITSAG